MNFTNQDLEGLESLKISKQEIKSQYQKIKSGSPVLNITEVCGLDNQGIIKLSQQEELDLLDFYDQEILKKNKKILKFVPASGAATRMFKSLIDFFNSSEKFSFHIPAIKQIFIEYLNLPKALINFHEYSQYLNNPKNPKIVLRTAFEEHLTEFVYYAKQSNQELNLHFTISPDYEQNFKNLLNKIKPTFENTYQIRLCVNFSYQDKSTDTIALDQDNKIAKDRDGNILLRPGGHGALINNLQEAGKNFDAIFIKNIDNVCYQKPTIFDLNIKWKKILGGLFFKIKQKNPDLNKPIAVCGMIKNKGDVGGGPFFIDSQVQIIENSQFKPHQEYLLANAKYFNPVDIVCETKNFDLKNYINYDAYIVTEKFDKETGSKIKALEHPGLWNGAMHYWHKVFVEVPIDTYNPVKTLHDLLNFGHQKL